MDDNQTLPKPKADDHTDTPSVQSSSIPQQSVPSGLPPIAVPSKAADIDLIEKEWVDKAKAIVASTLGDPRSQSQQISQAKSAYMSSRFNKELPKK